MRNVGNPCAYNMINTVNILSQTPRLSNGAGIVPLQISEVFNTMTHQTGHPNRDFWKAEVERIGNIATTDEKQDAIAHLPVEAQEEETVKIAEKPFEEKTETEKKLVRKIDLYLMPTIWILYCLSYMVRSRPLLYRSQAIDKLLGPHRHR